MDGSISLGKKIGKSSQNSPILTLLCILFEYKLLKVVSHYDLSDGFPNKKLWISFVSTMQFFLIFGICLTLQGR